MLPVPSNPPPPDLRPLQLRLAQGLLLLSALVIGWGMWTASSTALFITRSETTIGTVVSVRFYQTKNPAKRGTIPRIAFVTGIGQAVSFESEYGAGAEGYPVGRQVPVRYDPGNPQDARVDELYNLWFLPCVLLGWIGPFLLLMAAMFRYRRLLP